jgi:hypothetical protein
VEEIGDEILPKFPISPEGVVRLEHLPTVEACIVYWEAVRVRAARPNDRGLERTAEGLRLSFEQAREALKKEQRLLSTTADQHARRGRLRS